MDHMELPLKTIFMFQSWPDVAPNQNDSEMQLFSKYYNTIEKNFKNEILNCMTNNFNEDIPKSKNIANTFRNKGNRLFKILEYDAALEMYNNSICRAPRDSTEFALALANRSAVLHDMKKYKECLIDIDTVLRSEYPKNLLFKIFLRQSKCFVELNKLSEATTSLQRTQDSFDKEKKSMGTVQIALMEDSIKSVNKDIEERKEKETNTEEVNNNVLPIPTLKDGENPKFLNASNAVNIRYDTTFERSVVAASDINKGDVLFIENPYVFTPLNRPQNRFSLCSFCFQKSLNCIPCPTCTINFYCSNNCQAVAWDLNHKWECFNERRQIITDIRQKLCLSVLIRASREGFKTQVDVPSIYGDKDNNHPFMDKLLGHKTKVPDFVLSYNVKSAVWIVTYLKNFTDYFDWLYGLPNRPEGSKNDMYLIVGGYLVKYMLQTSCNLDVIQEGHIHFENDKSASVNYTAFGLGMYLSSALVNHSCIPNAVTSCEGKVKFVRALEDIKEGTEITVSYVGEGNEIDTEERQSRLDKYIFKCVCKRCTNPNYDDIYAPFLCPRCRGKALPRYRNKTSAKCTSCNLVFNRKCTKRVEMKIAELLLVFQLTGNVSHKNALYGILKKTFHRDNIIFIAYYHACLNHFEKTGEIPKCFDVIKSLADITENIYGNTSKQYVITMLQCTYLLVDYSNMLKAKNSKLYEKFLNETKNYLKKSVECLQYYVCPININEFVETINKSIKTGEIRPYVEDSDDDDDDSDMYDSDIETLAELCSFLR